MSAPTTEPAKPKRLPEAAMTRADVSLQDRELLTQAQAAVKQGRLAEGVEKYVEAARGYLLRAQPAKASQVLRQAARWQPEAVEVQILLAETLAQMKLPEDAAATYVKAAGLLLRQSRSGEWLDVVRKMMVLDPGDLHSRVRVAEALSRAGRRTEAAEMLRSLAGDLLNAGETEDWEQVAERLHHHAPDDTTTAHDLALHYVRTERHYLALPKLVACYEAEHRDAELLELVVDTLQAIGQREKAAAICRKLLNTYRTTGLRAEAERTLERLYDLDPDDAEARTYLGVLQPAVQGGTVIDFETGPLPPRRATSGSFTTATRRQESAGFDIPEVPLPSIRRTVRGVDSQPPAAVSRLTEPASPPLMADSDDDEFDGATLAVAEHVPLQRAIAPPIPAGPPAIPVAAPVAVPIAVPVAVRSQAGGPQAVSAPVPPRSATQPAAAEAKAVAGRPLRQPNQPQAALTAASAPSQGLRAIVAAAPPVGPPIPARAVSSQGVPAYSAPVHSVPAYSAPVHSAPVHSAPVHSAPVHSTQAYSGQAYSGHTHPAQAYSGHTHPAQAYSGHTHPAQAYSGAATAATVAASTASAQPPAMPPPKAVAAVANWSSVAPGTGSATGRVLAVPALDALASTLSADDDEDDEDEHANDANAEDWHSDDEAGFEVEDRALVEVGAPVEDELADAANRAPAPFLQIPQGAAGPDASALTDSATVPAQPQVPTVASLAATAPSNSQPVVSARQRSNSLPRPRLARRAGTVSELSTSVRDMTKDINTLEFFIERGFYDSAVALLDELCKRHPDSAQLHAYRTRIERMLRN